MAKRSRREFLGQTALGLMSSGAAGAFLTLRADARPTLNSADAAEAERILLELGPPPEPVPIKDGEAKQTRETVLGPFYRPGAPFRAKVCAPFEPGTVLVVSGRVWGHDTKKPLAGALLELWQVDIHGRYSSGDGNFKNHARLITSESGYYEFETVHPVAYQPNPDFWRSPHIHFIAQKPGYKRIVSEMFFKGDPKQDADPMFHSELAVPIEKRERGENKYETATFDIVLARA